MPWLRCAASPHWRCPDGRQAVFSGMLASFLLYAGAVVWVFAVRSAWRAWLGLVMTALPLWLIAQTVGDGGGA